jgi:lysophospholipase L1-like esterase
LTIGGNDAGFGQVMEYCAGPKPDDKSCQENSQAKVNRIILKQLPLKLFDLYRQIKSEPSLAPSAQILVLGYPQFFPTGQAASCPTGLVTGALGYEFQPSDMAWIDSVIKLVDSDIQAAASAVGLTYVDTSNAFVGNQLCQPDPDLNAAVFGPVLYSEGYPKWVQSFHPNAAGQRVLAQNVSPAVPFPTS